MDAFFALDFKILLVDAEARAVVVNGLAWLEAKSPRPIEVDNEYERIYAGFLETASMGNAILNFILPAYDKALTLQDATGQGRDRIRIRSVPEEE